MNLSFVIVFGAEIVVCSQCQCVRSIAIYCCCACISIITKNIWTRRWIHIWCVKDGENGLLGQLNWQTIGSSVRLHSSDSFHALPCQRQRVPFVSLYCALEVVPRFAVVQFTFPRETRDLKEKSHVGRWENMLRTNLRLIKINAVVDIVVEATKL